MNEKIGRNDPCPCGSGKKFKNCCWAKEKPTGSIPRKLTAKWINAPAGPNLIERAYGEVMAPPGQGFKALKKIEGSPTASESQESEEKKS